MRPIISKQTISLGGVTLCFKSELPLSLAAGMEKFRTEEERADATVDVKVMEEMLPLPRNCCGEDVLMHYYDDGQLRYAVAKTGRLGPVIITTYKEDCSQATVWVNEREHPGIVRTVNKVLQLFPIRRLLLQHQAMVLHASQIAVSGKGVLFTAPSGTGKSTQARLWNRFESVEIVCNDRTLLRKEENAYYTYGYYVDGKNPIKSNRKLELGAIVVLRQGDENRVQRLSALKASKYLVEQTMLDVWDREAISMAQLEWLEVLDRYPVYLLTCKPEREAVVCLKQALKRDGVK